MYDIVAGDVDAAGNGRSKASMLDDVPMSEAECQVAWIEAIAFEHEGSCYQPSPNALVQAWRSINSTALAEGIKLDSQFLTADITRAVAEEGYPESLVEAVLAYLSPVEADRKGTWSSLDRPKTVEFIGVTLLQAKRGEDFLIADFTDTWEDRLPEAWRKDAQLDAIQGKYEFSTETTIRAQGRTMECAASDSATTAVKPSARKWHEKFGKTRKK